MPKRVLIYSPFGEARAHTLYEITIALGLSLRGAEVRFICCDKSFSECDAHWERWGAKNNESCNRCIESQKEILDRFGLPYKWLSEYIDAGTLEHISKWVDQLDDQYLKGVVYKSYSLGDYAKSSVYSHFRISELDLTMPKVCKTLRGYIYSGAVAYESLKSVIEDFKPNLLFLFNGRFCTHRIALELARERGIRVLVHERGVTDQTIAFWENESCHGRHTFTMGWEAWKNVPLRVEELMEIHRILDRRRRGEGTNWFSFVSPTKSIQNILKLYKVPSTLRLVTLFTSSEDEFAGSSEYNFSLTQYEVIKRSIDYFALKKDFFLFIRIHPNTAKTDKLHSKLQELKYSLPDNVRIAMPNDSVNSYDLADLSVACIVYLSTIALEIAATGRPVLLCADLLQEQPFALNLRETESFEMSIARLLAESISTERIRWAYRYAYYRFVRRSVCFPLVSLSEVFDASLVFSSLDELLPGRDNALDQICDAILFDRLIYPLQGKPLTLSSNYEECFITELAKEVDAASPSTKKSISASLTSPNVRRILFVCHNIPPYEFSGTPLITLEQARALARRGNIVGVLIPDNEVLSSSIVMREDGIKLFSIPRVDRLRTFFDDPSEADQQEMVLMGTRDILYTFKPDIIHVNDYVDMPAGIMSIFEEHGAVVVREVWNDEEICFRVSPIVQETQEVCSGPETPLKCKVCFEMNHNDEYHDILSKLKHRFDFVNHIYNKIVDGIIFPSETFKNHFARYVSIPLDNISIIPHGVGSQETGHKAKKKISSKVRFTFIGNFFEFRKGLHLILDAFERLATYLNFQLSIYGSGSEKDHLLRINKLIKYFPDKISYGGPYGPKQLKRIMRETDVGIVPSYFETYSVVLREFLKHDTPVIATRFFGSEVIKNGLNGFLVEIGDSETLEKKMCELIESPSLLSRLQRGAKATVLDSTDHEAMGLSVLYETLLNKKHLADKASALSFKTHLKSSEACQKFELNHAQHGESIVVERFNGKSLSHIDKSTASEAPARLIAFYLPQFHPISENDRWWGKGFTEWRSCAIARPRFEGHYQPHLPSELGFYDLRLPEVRHAQAELARIHGLEGFCYWHYWFEGKLLLERPFNEVLKSGEPDFPFCLAWANENWTRRWDGLEQEILQKQGYGGEEDDRAHFAHILPALIDKRAIKIDNKPIFLFYRPGSLPNVSLTIELWRDLSEKAGLLGVYFIAITNSAEMDEIDWTKKGFDGELIFQPSFSLLHNFYKENRLLKSAVERISENDVIIPYDSAWPIMASVSERIENHNNRFSSVVPGWDNTPRRKEGGLVLNDSTPEAYGRWLQIEIKRLRNREFDNRVVFINAWNEWAEGNHLEPDLKFGRQYLETTKSIISQSSQIYDKTMDVLITDDKEKSVTLPSDAKSSESFFSSNKIGHTLHTPMNKDALVEYYKYRTKKLEDSLSAFYDSSGGRLLMRYYQLRDKCLPKETKRRMFIRRLFSIMRKKA